MRMFASHVASAEVTLVNQVQLVRTIRMSNHHNRWATALRRTQVTHNTLLLLQPLCQGMSHLLLLTLFFVGGVLHIIPKGYVFHSELYTLGALF